VTAITNKNRTYSFALLAVLCAIALAVAGCGGGGDSTSEGGDPGSKETASNASSSGPGGRYGASSENEDASAETAGAESGAAVVSLGSVKELGMVLVDSNGMTLYDFHKDKGTTSSCYDACAQAWPPLLTEGKPTVGNGASASKLGTTERKDGTTQVTYAGHPLYTYVVDQKPGEATGNDISAFGGEWYALQGNGEEPED
jgi:predicted lipoprotein with Yx(FWY)xxD motif